MNSKGSFLFVPYTETLELFGAKDALEICEEVYRMHARGSVVFSDPPSFRMDTAEFNNFWHVKGCLLSEIPVSGVRMYSYFDDGDRTTVGTLESTRFVVLNDPVTSLPIAIIDEHWSYGLRSSAAAVVGCKWLAPKAPRSVALIGVGTMCSTALQCLTTMYDFEEVRCTSRRPETRREFAEKWQDELGVPVVACQTVEEAVADADIVVGGTTSKEVTCQAEWLKPGVTFISLAAREINDEGWAQMDKVVLDDWTLNYKVPWFQQIADKGLLSRDMVHGEMWQIVTGEKEGRTASDEKIMIHTTGLVSQDVAIAHRIYERAQQEGEGISLPRAAEPAS
ncbi:ornithine cyclodeaminase family protein [Lentisalinibacter orientalis]|uniref:ornithine cyclodeaminase family protein n=1 Tax=Lentisalinibacter orientalis TaxID=2992241 RepID=UPI003863A110